MPNERYFAANTMAGFSTASAAVEVTTAGTFNSAYVPNSISVPSTGVLNGINLGGVNPGSLFWARFDFQWGGSNSGPVGNSLFQMDNIFRLFQVNGSSSLVQPQYWNGSTWVNAGSTYGPPGGRGTIAIKVTINSGYELYYNGVLQISNSGWAGGGGTTLNGWSIGNTSNNTTAYFSEVMIANYDLRNSHYAIAAINGNSATNTGQLSGTYTDVNETPYSDATAIIIGTVGNKAGQTKAALTVPVGLEIMSMVINARTRVSGAITNGKLGVRSAGTNYSSGNLNPPGAYGPIKHMLDLDPATAAKWTQTNFNSAEIYEEAA